MKFLKYLGASMLASIVSFFVSLLILVFYRASIIGSFQSIVSDFFETLYPGLLLIFSPVLPNFTASFPAIINYFLAIFFAFVLYRKYSAQKFKFRQTVPLVGIFCAIYLIGGWVLFLVGQGG